MPFSKDILTNQKVYFQHTKRLHIFKMSILSTYQLKIINYIEYLELLTAINLVIGRL